MVCACVCADDPDGDRYIHHEQLAELVTRLHQPLGSLPVGGCVPPPLLASTALRFSGLTKATRVHFRTALRELIQKSYSQILQVDSPDTNLNDGSVTAREMRGESVEEDLARGGIRAVDTREALLDDDDVDTDDRFDETCRALKERSSELESENRLLKERLAALEQRSGEQQQELEALNAAAKASEKEADASSSLPMPPPIPRPSPAPSTPPDSDSAPTPTPKKRAAPRLRILDHPSSAMRDRPSARSSRSDAASSRSDAASARSDRTSARSDRTSARSDRTPARSSSPSARRERPPAPRILAPVPRLGSTGPPPSVRSLSYCSAITERAPSVSARAGRLSPPKNAREAQQPVSWHSVSRPTVRTNKEEYLECEKQWHAKEVRDRSAPKSSCHERDQSTRDERRPA